MSDNSGSSHSLVESVPALPLCFPLSFSESCTGSCAVSDAGDEDGAELPRGLGKRSFCRAVLIGESGLSISKTLNKNLN